jgi:hypothetical protein
MRKTLTAPAAAVAATAVGAGTVLARKVVAARHWVSGARGPSGRRLHDTDVGRWRAVTVLRRADEMPTTLPPALADLGDAVDVEIRTAPDGKGSVLAARLVDPGRVDADPARAVDRLRTALRHGKQQIEIGWVVTPTRSPVVETPLNSPLREAESHAEGESVR